ncbi:MAG: NAD-dependent epimerase/dehydratase family protein, partial [Alphaproteobacteria bacterium]|nr:NAD-dependent epimerase/dehydratase family protein [Alphaproteobacteria bacterium]
MSPAPDSPARVLVLGATGHIGSAVVRHLLRHGYSVKGLARAPSTSTRGLPIAWVYADLTRLRSSGDW